jgi:hypothetical protein
VITATSKIVTILTSTNYLVDINWDATFPTGQIYYTGASCTGTAYLNSGTANPSVMWGRKLVYSGSFASLMVPATVDASGVSTASGSFTVASIDNPACGTSTTGHGWELATITNTAAGLPSTIAAPLAFE